jgi:O-antigen ligase
MNAAADSSFGLVRDTFEVPSRGVSAPVVGAAILTLCFVTQILQLVPELEGLHLAKLAAVFAVLAFLFSRDGIYARSPVRSVPQFIAAIGLLVLGAGLAPLSLWPARSLEFIVEVFAKNVLFIYLVIHAARTDGAARVITRTLIAGNSALAAALLFAIGPIITYRNHPDRAAIGTTYDANDLALLFVVTIPFAFFQLRSSRPVARCLLLAAIAVLLGGIVVTGSRGGFLGLVVVAVAVLIQSSAQTRKYAVFAVGTGAILFALAAPASYWSRINTIINYETDYNLTDRAGRLTVWSTGVDVFLSIPVIGAGINCFPLAHRRFSETKAEIGAHNSFLQVAAELGVPGLILFSGGIAATFRAARRRRHSPAEPGDRSDWLAPAIQASLAGFVASAFFLSHAYSAVFCFLLAMGGVLVVRERRRLQEATENSEVIEYA